MTVIKKIGSFHSQEDFISYLQSLGIEWMMPECYADSDQPQKQSAMKRPFSYKSAINGNIYNFSNRWAVLPMEGWDCNPNGTPSDLTYRRWEKFAVSGAKLLFGGEAAAVVPSGKANTRQMMVLPDTIREIAALRKNTIDLHRNRFGSGDDPVIGLQLTHSGRFSKPNDDFRPEPKTAYQHPILDKKFHCGPKNVLSDGEIEGIIEHFHNAGRLAQEAGFDFVDVKSAHGYLGHEFLTAYNRPGKFGGSFENRTRFFRDIVEGIKKSAPGLEIGVRFSIFDLLPFEKGPDDVGRPIETEKPYRYAFGSDETGLSFDLNEPFKFLELVQSLGIRLVGSTAGSPYYNPHIQRPAAFAVSDGYSAPEEPLLGVARQVAAVAEVKKRFPQLVVIGAGYTYLQEFLPAAAEQTIMSGKADFIGIGRMMLAYPELIADSLAGRPLDTHRICRTFGDCTNAPRRGLVSGCYPLDTFYKNQLHAEILKTFKQ